MYTLSENEEASTVNQNKMNEALKDYPKAVAKSGTEKILQNGGKIHTSQTKDALYDAKGLYRVYTASGVFVGLFRYSKERGEIQPGNGLYQAYKTQIYAFLKGRKLMR